MLLDIENIGKAVGISLLSRIQAAIYVIPYPLPVTGRNIWYITHPGVGSVRLAIPCFWTSNMAFSPGHSLIFHYSYREIYSYILSVRRDFEFVWAWLIILRDLRHQKTCDWAPLSVGQNRIKKFQSVPEIQGTAPFQLCICDDCYEAITISIEHDCSLIS